MPSSSDDLRARTKRFAFDVIKLVKHLPHNIATDAIARQLIRSGTSVASNHRSACRGQSRREFIAKLGVVLDEADESQLWLEALVECELTDGTRRETVAARSRRAPRDLRPIRPHGT